jgi:glycosyltransferase involved in cell wall biosynthesis
MINGFGSGGRLAQQLRAFKPQCTQRRRPDGRLRKVLHLLSQQPGKTGSGVALLALVRWGANAGWKQRTVIGLPASEPLPGIPPLKPSEIFSVTFDRPPVAFAIPGMSDIMPYPSTRFSTFTPEMLESYLQAFAVALAHATADFKPDLIQSNHLWLLTALARLLFPQTPLCVYCHGTELRQMENAAHLKPFVLPACSDVDRVLALHADNRARIIHTYAIQPDNVRIVGAGFRDDLFRSKGECLEAAERDELIIVYAGKISVPKGVPWLIEAFRRIRPPSGKRVRLLLAGASGDASAEVIRRQAAGLEGVEFLGAVPQETLAEVLQKADVFVLPSFFEGLPLVVVESLACGCRVVMTDLPGIDSWVPQRLCFEGRVEKVPLPRLTGPDTPVAEDLPEFVEKLAEALNRQLTRSLESSRTSDTHACLETLTWAAVFERVESSWRELTAG